MAAPKLSNKKQEGQKTRMYNGKVVKSCLYNGRAVGHGKYMAAMIDDQFVLDKQGKPLQYTQVGELV